MCTILPKEYAVILQWEIGCNKISTVQTIILYQRMNLQLIQNSEDRISQEF